MSVELPCEDCGKIRLLQDGLCPVCTKKAEDAKIEEVEEALDRPYLR